MELSTRRFESLPDNCLVPHEDVIGAQGVVRSDGGVDEHGFHSQIPCVEFVPSAQPDSATTDSSADEILARVRKELPVISALRVHRPEPAPMIDPEPRPACCRAYFLDDLGRPGGFDFHETLFSAAMAHIRMHHRGLPSTDPAPAVTETLLEKGPAFPPSRVALPAVQVASHAPEPLPDTPTPRSSPPGQPHAPPASMKAHARDMRAAEGPGTCDKCDQLIGFGVPAQGQRQPAIPCSVPVIVEG